MDPLSTLNPLSSGIGGFNPGLSLYPNAGLSGLAQNRLVGFAPVVATAPQAQIDPTMGALLQNQMVMQQTLTQLMQMMLSLMANGKGSNLAGALSGMPGLASGGGVSGGGASGGSSAATGTFGSSSATEPIGNGTESGKKLAQFAQAEATNGDSSGGLCFRDVSRALSKMGIETHGASAYMAADQLAKNPKVKEVKVGKDQLKTLPAGAIVVWDRGAGHEHGHISIALGNGKEASDLLRDQITNYGTSFRVFMPQ